MTQISSDIYLYYCPDLAAAEAAEEAYETACHDLWDTHPGEALGELSCISIADQLGVNEAGVALSRQPIERPSTRCPEHEFRVGHWRTVHGLNGLDRMLRRLELPGLRWVFGTPDDRGEVHPDWADVHARLHQLINQFRDQQPYRVMMAGYEPDPWRVDDDSPPTTPDEALQLVRRRLADSLQQSRPGGTCWVLPRQLVGVVPGRGPAGEPVVYIVTRPQCPEDDYDYQGLAVIGETVEFVLHQHDPNNYYLLWDN